MMRFLLTLYLQKSDRELFLENLVKVCMKRGTFTCINLIWLNFKLYWCRKTKKCSLEIVRTVIFTTKITHLPLGLVIHSFFHSHLTSFCILVLVLAQLFCSLWATPLIEGERLEERFIWVSRVPTATKNSKQTRKSATEASQLYVVWDKKSRCKWCWK